MRAAAIIYCTKHGQTEKIANRVKEHLMQKHVAVQMFSVDHAPKNLDPNFDSVIVGGPIYIGHYSPALVNWVKQHKVALDCRLTGFFSVSLNAADSRTSCRVVDEHLLKKFMKDTGWQPTFAASFAGALKYSRYNWLLRKLMQWKSKAAHGPVDMAKDYELTDWAKVDMFIDCLFGSHELERQFRVHI